MVYPCRLLYCVQLKTTVRLEKGSASGVPWGEGLGKRNGRASTGPTQVHHSPSASPPSQKARNSGSRWGGINLSRLGRVVVLADRPGTSRPCCKSHCRPPCTTRPSVASPSP